MGALGAALSCKGAATQHSLTLSSAKACYGHTEGAAGLTGALLAMQSSLVSLHTPILHLAKMNSYVEAAVGDWARVHSLAGMAPRSRKPGCPAGQAAGTSSFGMSGVNAHLLLTALPEAAGAEDRSTSTMVWQCQRH